MENVYYNEIQDIVHVFEGEDVFVIWDENGKVRFSININNKPFYKLSEITEEQASSIVEIHKNWQLAEDFYVDYLNYGCIYSHFKTATESLHSLLESQGIEITNNTYIFKV